LIFFVPAPCSQKASSTFTLSYRDLFQDIFAVAVG